MRHRESVLPEDEIQETLHEDAAKDFLPQRVVPDVGPSDLAILRRRKAAIREGTHP